MNSKNIKAIKNTDNLCYKCLKKKDNIHQIDIGSRGYGSYFDNFGTSLYLCDSCYNESTQEAPIWNMQALNENDIYDDSYLYDNEMYSYIDNLPLESRELVFNRNAYGSLVDCSMKPQDYIDYELDELPHKKCKQYGLYSPQEKAAYEERFPNCECVKIDKYKDGSQGSSCPYGAFGDRDGNVGLNMYDECYMCSHYKPRNGDIKVIDKVEEYYKNEKDRLIHMIQYAGSRLAELEKDVGEYMNKHIQL